MKTTLILMFLFASTAVAGVYRWVDGQGQVHFSDQPAAANAKQIELRETSIYSPPSFPTQAPATSAGAPPAKNDASGDQPVAYTSVAIVSPEPDEPIRSNNGQVNISIELQPGLQPGDSIRVFLDGTQAAEDLDSTQISLQDVDRGTHTLSVGVINSEGKEVMRSDTINFHLLRIAAPRVNPFGGGG